MNARIKLAVKMLIVCGTFFGVQSGFAGYLTEGATIRLVANTASNEKNFIVVLNGTSSCPGGITFPEALAASPQAHNRAYAAALLAFTTGAQVKIHNYVDNSCERASQIQLFK